MCALQTPLLLVAGVFLVWDIDHPVFAQLRLRGCYLFLCVNTEDAEVTAEEIVSMA